MNRNATYEVKSLTEIGFGLDVLVKRSCGVELKSRWLWPWAVLMKSNLNVPVHCALKSPSSPTYWKGQQLQIALHVQSHLAWKFLFFLSHFRIRNMNTICPRWTNLVWWERTFFNWDLINCIYAFRLGNYWCFRWNLSISRTWSILLYLLFLTIHHFFNCKFTAVNLHLSS